MPHSRFAAIAFATAFFLSTPAVALAGTSDLSVTHPVIVGALAPGAEITYTYSVSNAGPDATEVTVNDGLSGLEQLVSITPSQGTCGPTEGGSLCNVGSVASGSTVAFSVKVKLTEAGNYQHTAFVMPTDGQTLDPNQDNGVGGIAFDVNEPETEYVDTPSVSSGVGYRRTQSTLGVDAELSPHGAGTYYFEYGRTRSFGKKTDSETISTQKSVKRQAVIRGLAMKTRIYWRVVLVVDGRAYRGKTRSETTLGKMLYPLITIKATKRTASSTTYVGTIGDGYADAPGACKGKITMRVYTEGADLLQRRTTVDAKGCKYKITIPFGTSDARRYGPKGKGVFVQAEFSGTKAVAVTRSTSDRP